MAHGIKTERDFQYGLRMAWHKLTKTPANGAPLTRELLPDVIARDLGYQDESGQWHFLTDSLKVAVCSDDGKPIDGTVHSSDSYTLFTPRMAWDYVHKTLAGTGFEVGSMGMIFGRTQWFISTTLSELNALECGGRKTEFQLNFSGGLDRSMSPQCELSSTMIVCANTLAISRASGQILFKKKATANFLQVLESQTVTAEIEKAAGMTAIFKAQLDKLASKPANEDKARATFLGYLTPKDNDRATQTAFNTTDELTSLFKQGRGNNGQTMADVLCAGTEFWTRGPVATKRDLSKIVASSEFGPMADKKADFFNLLTTPQRAPELAKLVSRGHDLILAGPAGN